MFNQMYYSVRNRLWIRLTAFSIMSVGNVFFYFLVRSQDNLMAWQTAVAVIFAAFSFLGVLIVNLIVSGYSFGMVFTEPDNYLTMLTPVPAWKLLLGRLIPSIVIDMFGILLGIFFIVNIATSGYATMTAYGVQSEMSAMFNSTLVYYIIILMAGYAFLLSFGVFWETISKTLLRNIPGRKLVGGVVALLAAIALSWINAILLPFGEMSRFGPFLTILIFNPSSWHLVVVILLVLVQAAVLLIASAQLIDRR